MSTRLVLLSFSVAGCLSLQGAAAQGLPYEMQFRCPFQIYTLHPLLDRDCDDERVDIAGITTSGEGRNHGREEHKNKHHLDIHHLGPIIARPSLNEGSAEASSALAG